MAKKQDEDLVGVLEIAELLGVRQQTVRAWRYRAVMPEPDWVVSGTPIWRRGRIEEWARHRPSLQRQT